MEPGRPPRKETSPWVYVGCGCAALVILAMAGMAGLTYVAYRQGKKMEQAWSDPAARESGTREVLAYDELPAGYHPLGSFSLPFVMDMAMFTDSPPPPGAKPDQHDSEPFKERGFIYVKTRRFGGGDRELRDFLEGKGDEPEWLRGNADLDAGEVLRRGEVDANGQRIVYTASRGEVKQSGQHMEGITTMLMIDCPQDRRVRFGIWFGPDPDPGKPAAEIDLAGTHADPEEIRKFASHFRFCPGN
jgi:hypothetical protein